MSIVPPSHLLASPENVRTIFFTNLILLGIQAHSSQAQTQNHPHPHQQQHQLPIIIDSLPTGSNISRPLELNKHVFSRGHQSTKALEFILWFLFTRLDKSQARDRFKGCWPVLDHHDAREFRNVAFKWMEELRKDGCFSIGHNLEAPSSLEPDSVSGTQQQQRAPRGGGLSDPQMLRTRTNSFSSTTSLSFVGSNVRSGLGMFIPTIRRSYLDESIGERLEQLVLVLSTYVLAQVVKQEVQANLRSKRQGITGNKDHITLIGLAGAVPETQQEEEELLNDIDSQIAARTELLNQDLEKQSASRQKCDEEREDLDAKLHRLSQDATKLESDRDAFLKRQSQLAGRSKTSAEEIRQLGDDWSKKMVNQWQPILSFIERRIKNNGTQALVDPNSNRKMSNGSQLDVPLALSHLLEQAGMNHTQNGRPDVDLSSVLKTWKGSLQAVGIKHSSISSTDKGLNTLDSVYEHHKRHLGSVRDSKHKLEKKLREASRRVERLQKEQSILQWPYRRLLTTIPTADATPTTNKPKCQIEAEAVEDAEHLSRHFVASRHDASSSDGPNDIKNRVRQSVRQVEQHFRPLLTDLGSKDQMDILSAPPIPIEKVPAVIHHTHLKPIIRAPQTQVAPPL
ncbi:HAUS augmin-like complex subunit 6 [Podila clonocystis]|nr:HAUS augmin-like complex subunit 6 [Podila clonocystis]